MDRKIYLYPKWVRIWHLSFVVMFVILAVTGISMHYTGRKEHAIAIDFAQAVKWHGITAILFIISYLSFVIGNILTANGKYYKPEAESLRSGLRAQVKYYISGMFKKEKTPFPVNPQRKFNPLQKITYILVMYLALPLLIISGLGLFFPGITGNKFHGASGLIPADIIHISAGFILTLFMVVHIYSCTLGPKPFSLFREMITGYHEEDEGEGTIK